MIVETLFALPGIGRLLVDSILQRDLIMVQGVALGDRHLLRRHQLRRRPPLHGARSEDPLWPRCNRLTTPPTAWSAWASTTCLPDRPRGRGRRDPPPRAPAAAVVAGARAWPSGWPSPGWSSSASAASPPPGCRCPTPTCPTSRPGSTRPAPSTRSGADALGRDQLSRIVHAARVSRRGQRVRRRHRHDRRRHHRHRRRLPPGPDRTGRHGRRRRARRLSRPGAAARCCWPTSAAASR